jgi:uncharacterized phage protein (TIGR01671 family)
MRHWFFLNGKLKIKDMAREIKFRFWTKDAMMLEDHFGFSEGIGINEALNASKELDYIPMQYTGLKDKNGKKVFEGDILGCVDSILLNWVVSFRNGCFGISNIMDSKNIGDFYHIEGKYFFDNREIIGNIYENSVLLN